MTQTQEKRHFPDDAALWEGYLARTRWFGGKGRPFHVSRVYTLAELPAVDGGPHVTVYIVSVEYSDEEAGTENYQVPLSSYADPQDRIAYAFVGSVEGDDGGIQHLYDAAHDSAAMGLWLEGFVGAEETGTAQRDGLRFRRLTDPVKPLDPALESTPLTGEQSNTSVKFDGIAIMKLFRKVSAGINPDIEIHEVLTRGGSDYVADLYGWVERDVPEEYGGVLQLAMVQEFLRTATDGFELATGSVRTLLADLELSVEESGGDFAGEAARLGEALAAVHRMLRESFPTQGRGADIIRSLADAMIARLEHARRIVPEIEPYAGRLRAAYDAVGAMGRLDVQRVHGDLHLGQTLRTTEGWKLVDFEGEPGRPFAERALPDSPWRDVAGMLRSFDYAARVVEMSNASAEDVDAPLRAQRAREWSARARRLFLEGYVAALGPDAGPEQERGVLLDAYVADKAVYEAVYEKRNRPSWIGIPLAALERISG